MKATLVLTSEILKGTRPAALTAAVTRSAGELETDIKENMAPGPPRTGRIYRLGPIVRTSNRRNAVPGLRKRGDKTIVGSNFYRSSSEGQPPAIRTGRLLNSIGSRSLGPTSARVSVSVEYGLPLDDPEGLNRPFFMSRAVAYLPRFQKNVLDAYTG